MLDRTAEWRELAALARRAQGAPGAQAAGSAPKAGVMLSLSISDPFTQQAFRVVSFVSSDAGRLPFVFE
jgi:hypothetical protein